MKNMSDMYKKEIVTTSGRVLGTLDGFAVKNDWTVSGLTVKINNDVMADLGLTKPFLGSLRLDVGVNHVKAMGDNIVLNKSIPDLNGHLTEYHENNNASNIVKMEIVDSKGRDVGAVEDVILDDKLWRIPSVLVSVNKEVSEILNVKKPLLSNSKVSLSTQHINGAWDKVMLSVTTEHMSEILEQVPTKPI